MKNPQDDFGDSGIVGALAGILLFITVIGGAIFVINRYAENLDGATLVDINKLECWSIAEGELGMDGWHRAHFADKHVAKPGQLFRIESSIICFAVDKDGLPGKKKYFLKQWWRKV